MTSVAIDMKQVRKTYGKKVVAVENLSLQVKTGSIFALLGPNGSGKTTTIRMLTSLVSKDGGDIHIFGENKIDKHVIGCVAQNSGVDPLGTGKENLMMQGKIYGLKGQILKKRVDELLKMFHLEKDQNRLSKNYSGGMKRKLDLAMGIIHKPRLLFLDEPTTGLDPEARSDLWKMIKQLQEEQGMTVVLTTHYMEEADELADYVAFMNEGKLVIEGTKESLKRGMKSDTLIFQSPHVEKAKEVLQGENQLVVKEDKLHVQVTDGATKLPELLHELKEHGVDIDSVTLSKVNLGDVYFMHTGKTLMKGESK
ncbi:ABC transporter ATP-binding protein [Alkalihalobacillus pseudalcaliphilus]|uniref:ABC transporter ATP-binding protein n=1 Tax=Alkalihalobacillus pseudalcaliphilus TaxID=79884 RepID=UPI00064DA1C9|nr:ABC transporter ATP-binding protein [Alkalihalobacillus pseudalcaliphilus]KMK77495.1 hypothetical protein AB990_03215 [Alkalihalobacillus pseudalcaliphilus]